jgi:hypothetical protein
MCTCVHATRVRAWHGMHVQCRAARPRQAHAHAHALAKALRGTPPAALHPAYATPGMQASAHSQTPVGVNARWRAHTHTHTHTHTWPRVPLTSEVRVCLTHNGPPYRSSRCATLQSTRNWRHQLCTRGGARHKATTRQRRAYVCACARVGQTQERARQRGGSRARVRVSRAARPSNSARSALLAQDCVASVSGLCSRAGRRRAARLVRPVCRLQARQRVCVCV